MRKTAIILSIYIFSITSCERLFPEEDNSELELAAMLALTPPPGEYFARLYYLSPLLTGSPNNLNLIMDVNQPGTYTGGKKKLVIVHGWHFDDRDNIGYPLPFRLRERIRENWATFFTTGEYASILANNYDIYAFDYLTSNGVDLNGIRFRQRMDALFAGESNNVVIYANSMGGLVTRFAIYEREKPAYVTRVISTGTPYHGSPWASPEFQANSTVLGSIAGFLTQTTGGSDLRYDNFDNRLPGASNPKLTALNQKTDRDSLFYAYYGSYPASATGTGGTGAGGTLVAACHAMGATWEPSDCIVPQASASLSGNTLAATRDIGNYDHVDMKMEVSAVRTQFLADLP